MPKNRQLADGCIACNSSKVLCDCLIWNDGNYDGKPCCPICQHLEESLTNRG